MLIVYWKQAVQLDLNTRQWNTFSPSCSEWKRRCWKEDKDRSWGETSTLCWFDSLICCLKQRENRQEDCDLLKMFKSFLTGISNSGNQPIVSKEHLRLVFLVLEQFGRRLSSLEEFKHRSKFKLVNHLHTKLTSQHCVFSSLKPHDSLNLKGRNKLEIFSRGDWHSFSICFH